MPVLESKLVKFWPTPTKGIARHVPIYQIPDDALYDSMNVIEQDGRLLPRPGLVIYDSPTLNGTPVGAITYTKTANTPVIFLVTTTKVYSSSGLGSWTDRTLGALTGTASNRAMFTSIVLGNTSPVSYVIFTNGVDAPQKWDGTAGTVSTVAGTPPVWTDVTTISDRIIGIKPPYNVSWSPVRRIDSWPALNYHQAAFTPDEVVAIRNLGVQGGVLYKRRSIWMVSPTGFDSDAKAYRFDLYGLYDGPAGPSAVVDADGIQVRMTSTGRIGVFDGSKHSWVGDGVWPLLKDTNSGVALDLQYAHKIFGVYDPENRIVTFFYPRTSLGAVPATNMVMVTLPTDLRQDFGCFLGQVGVGVDGIATALTHPNTYGQNLPLAIGNKNLGVSTVFQLAAIPAGETDAGEDFSGHWQTGLSKLPESMRLEGIELYAGRSNATGNIMVEPVTSWALANNGDIGTKQEISLNLGDVESPREAIGFDNRARFFGLRFSFDTTSWATDGASSDSTRGYKGCSLFGQKLTV